MIFYVRPQTYWTTLVQLFKSTQICVWRLSTVARLDQPSFSRWILVFLSKQGIYFKFWFYVSKIQTLERPKNRNKHWIMKKNLWTQRIWKKKHWKGTSLRDKNRNKNSNIKSKRIETNKLSYWTVYNSFNINFQLTEIPLPVRFIFIYLVPDDWDRDVREVGRTMGTLLSNPVSFHILCNLRFSVLIFNNKMQQHSQSLMSLFCGCSLVNL